MKNTLGDLNNHLFESLERLNDDDLTEEELQDEIKRAKAVTEVASKIIDNGSLVLEAQKYTDSKWNANAKTPKMLEG